MKIFLIWPTWSWKTTAAKFFERNLWFVHIQASKILSNLNPQWNHESRAVYKKRLTDISYKILQSNYSFFVDAIHQQIEKIWDNHCIIEWVRNPQDFAMLYNPHSDIVRRFDWEYLTAFEEYGLTAIDAMLWFFKTIYPQVRILNWINNLDSTAEENFITNYDILWIKI